MDAVRFQAEQKSIALGLFAKKDLPQVNVDIEKTVWVMINFLSNALRYSAEKSKIVLQILQKAASIEFSVRILEK